MSGDKALKSTQAGPGATPASPSMGVETPVEVLPLYRLREKIPGLGRDITGFYLAACFFCLRHHHHPDGVTLRLIKLATEAGLLLWFDEAAVTNYDFMQFGGLYQLNWLEPPAMPEEDEAVEFPDREEAAEYGAYGLAVLLALKTTRYTRIERAAKGDGFDFWLGHHSTDLPFDDGARLEVSGLLQAHDDKVKERAKKKIKQVAVSDDMGLPALIVICEFGRPITFMVEKRRKSNE